ncbi:MAG: extracellular solute-binding protein [Chloroflexota bacterium]|nr:extracellular solute-binding protein [Chloroflexota bacterium]
MKGIKILFAIAVLVLALAPVGAQDVTTVTMWFSEGSTLDCWGPLMLEFNDIDPSIQLEIVPQANAWDVTRTAVAGGGGPDVVRTPGPSFVYEMAQAGLILPMDTFAESMGWGDFFFDWALDLGLVDGQLYSLSDELETLVMYYNVEVFEENGWTPPDTMDELNALAAEVEAAGLTVFSHGNASWRPTNEHFVGEYWTQVAGPHKVYQALSGEIPWTDESLVEAIELLDAHMQAGWYGGGVDLYFTNDGVYRRTSLAEGSAAMNIEGSWAIRGTVDYFGESGMTWDWVPVPSHDGTDYYTIGMGNTSSINANSPHPEAAAQFLTWYFSPATQGKMLTNCLKGPAPVAIGADVMAELDPRIARLYAELSDASANDRYGYTTWTFWPPKSDVYIYEEVERVWTGEITAMEYSEGLQELFAEELDAGDIPPIPTR